MASLLLVEDTADLAQVIIHEFEAAGFDVYHAADGETGLAPK